MSLSQNLNLYTTDKNGIIQDNGKFEGEMVFIPYLWNDTPDENWINDERELSIYFAKKVRKDWPEYAEGLYNTYAVVLASDESGFVFADYISKDEYNKLKERFKQ
jgi:hypothetical protein